MKYFFTITGIGLFSWLAIAPLQLAQAASVNTARYRCEEGGVFRAEYYEDSAVVAYDGETFTLPQVESGSGTRYSDGTMTLYSEGDEAFIEVGDETIFDDCEAYLVGSADYTEEESTIVIETERRVEFNRPQTLAAPAPAPTPAAAPAVAPAPEPISAPAPAPVPGLW